MASSADPLTSSSSLNLGGRDQLLGPSLEVLRVSDCLKAAQ